MNKGIKGFMNNIGPGLMYAGAAIGVSHLIQSTRAGAIYGFGLLAFVFIANILKYPFFETGSRYAGATGKSLLSGYRSMGRPVIWFYIVQTQFTMFIIQAAVTLVTAGLLKTFTGWGTTDWLASSVISTFCILIIVIGKFRVLQNTTRWIVITLSLCTIIALVFAMLEPINRVDNSQVFSFQNTADIAFFIALIGWMPAPIDISIWQSVWRVQGKHDKNLKSALTDFHIGYWGTAVLSIVFLSLGAFIFYNSGVEIASGSTSFAAQLIQLYTESIGNWSWFIVAFAAFATMFTTSLTCLDANPRVIRESISQLNLPNGNTAYGILLLLSAIGAVILPFAFRNNMTALVDFATTVSFMTAPVFATLNYRINFHHLEKESQPGLLNKVISIIGLIFLYGFALYFLFTRFIG